MRFLVAAILAGLLTHGVALAAEPIPPTLDPSRACPHPKYPAHAREIGAQGAVTMRFLIDLDGTVEKGEIQSSSGNEELDQAAFSALGLCHFKPGSEPGWARLKYTWKLDEPKTEMPPVIVGSTNCGFPLYPDLSVAKNETGRSIVTLALDEDGAVSRIDMESSGFPRLDAAARTSLGTCRFSSVIREVRVPLEWQIQNGMGIVSIEDVKTIAR